MELQSSRVDGERSKEVGALPGSYIVTHQLTP